MASDTASKPVIDVEDNCRTLLLRFVASLTLADHMGDVSGDVSTVLEAVGEKELADLDWEDLGTALGKRGITTLYGTDLSGDEDDE